MTGVVLSAAARALVLGASCLLSALPARAQSALDTGSPSSAAVVVFVPTRVDGVAASRIGRAIDGREVAAVYTTDTPAAYHAAQTAQARFGGSLIPYDRLSRPANDFGDLLFHNAVEYAGRRHRGQAILVVADPDLTLPFLRRAVSPRALDRGLERKAEDGFLIALGRDGSRSVTPLPF